MQEFLNINGDWISENLKATGKTQQWLADELGVGRAQISRWISGDRNPSRAAKKSIFEAIKKSKENL